MSGDGAYRADVPGSNGLKVAIVASRWHDAVMSGLLTSAQGACTEAGAETSVTRVPGAFEVPVVAAELAREADAVVALAAVIRGGTPHFEYVCHAITDGLLRVSLDSGTPVGFGVLTCDSDSDAIDRAGLPGSAEDKGREAALAAIEAATVLRQLRLRGQ